MCRWPKKCADNKIVSCTEDGTWDEGVACVAPTALCDVSSFTCVAELSKCIKGDMTCNGNRHLTCKEDGTWHSGIECSGATPICDSVLKKCVAKNSAKDCSKDEHKCDGNKLVSCSEEGSWNAGVECSGATPICDAKLKTCIASVKECSKDEKKCDGNRLVSCSEDGTWNPGVECSGATPTCDAAEKKCISTSCVGNMIVKDDGQPEFCLDNKVCVDGACVDFELISMELPAIERTRSNMTKDILIVTANAPAREDIEIALIIIETQNGYDKTMIKSLFLKQGDKIAYDVYSARELLDNVSMTIIYNDDMGKKSRLDLEYGLWDMPSCETGETKCLPEQIGSAVCSKSEWILAYNNCARLSQVCLLLTGDCGSNTLRSISPFFLFARPDAEYTFTLMLESWADEDLSFYLDGGSDLDCEVAHVALAANSVTTTCKLKTNAVLGRLVDINVHYNADFSGKIIGTSKVWLAAK